MLPPVAAVSNTSSVAAPREIVVVTEALAGLAAEPDGAVALSLAVSSGVEGKLNMLLINARERMIDSLFAVIDAVSQSLALPQETGESNASYALRLADTVTALPQKQMAALQQQLATQGQTAPLSLVAAALHDPTSAQAAQLVAYLEVVRYKDKDLATKSVVASYGQNDGSTEEPATATPARSLPAQTAPMANAATALPQPGATPATVAVPAAQTELPAPAQKVADTPVPVSTVAVASGDAAEPEQPQGQVQQQSQPNPSAAAAGNQPSAARTAATVAQGLQTTAPETATEVTSLPAVALNPEETTPRVILQIRSDIKEGLKAVFDRLVQATGTELLQTMAEAEPLADKVIAEALIADMIDGTELDALTLPDNVTVANRAPPLATAFPVSQASATVAEGQAAPLIAVNQQTEDTPEPVPTVVPQQPPLVVPPGLAVGFVTTPYAPAKDVVKSRDSMPIDRVDAVDDDEHEGPGNQQQQDEAESEPETSAEEALDMLAAEPDNPLALAEEPAPSRSSLVALPHYATPEPLLDPGYDLYARMGA